MASDSREAQIAPQLIDGRLRFIFQDWGPNSGMLTKSVLAIFRLEHLIRRSAGSAFGWTPVSWLNGVMYTFVFRVVNSGYIHPEAQIGPRLRLPNGLNGVFISSHSSIGSDVSVYQQVTLGENFPPHDRVAPMIGDEVVIGAGAKVLGGVTVGDRAVVGANSVVSKDVPPDYVAVGNPARVLKLGSREAQEMAESGAIARSEILQAD